MKLVIDARESGTSTGRYVDKLIEYLAKLKPNHQVEVLTKTSRMEALMRLAPGFRVTAADFKEFTFSEQLGFKKFLKQQKADLVHFSMTQQPAFYRGKVVTTVHDLTTIRFYNPSKNWLIYKLKQQVYRWVIKRVARKSLVIITPSQYVKEDLIRFANVSPEKVRVTYEAADKISEPPKPLSTVKANKFIMYVGRPNPHKNLPRLVQAFEALQAQDPSLQLVLVGKTDALYEKMADRVQKRGIENVVFTGHVSEGELRWLYENTLAYIFPSLSEGFGLPGLEAMIHGAPVVSSNATCLPEIYGSAAQYFNPLDVTDMSSKIKQVIEDKNLRQRLVAAGSKQFQKYSWQKMTTQTLAIYNEVL